MKLLEKIFGGKKTEKKTIDFTSRELCELAAEYRIRELAFLVCVNMVASAIGKCEFKTLKNGEEIQEREYYLLNVEPNQNENSTAFWHKVVYKLLVDNECLIIRLESGDMVVADSFMQPLYYPYRMQEYTGVIVGETSFQRTFYEPDVIHLKLNCINIKPVIDALQNTYNKLFQAAVDSLNWANGLHLKVHVEQMMSGGEGWEDEFNQMITDQVKPFFNSTNAVLPEFDGYKYENFGSNHDAVHDTRDIKALTNDIFEFTARAFLIPPVLLLGDIAGTKDAMERWLTTCIDPIADQIQEEWNRKRYGYKAWKQGNSMRIDTSTILHFDLFGNAANIEKLIGSGAFSINDIRTAAGQTPIDAEWANEHWMTKNIATMEDASTLLAKGGEINGNQTETDVAN